MYAGKRLYIYGSILQINLLMETLTHYKIKIKIGKLGNLYRELNQQYQSFDNVIDAADVLVRVLDSITDGLECADFIV